MVNNKGKQRKEADNKGQRQDNGQQYCKERGAYNGLSVFVYELLDSCPRSGEWIAIVANSWLSGGF